MYQVFGLDLSEIREIIIFGSLLTTFVVSNVFGGSWGSNKIGSSQKLNRQIKLSLPKSLIHSVAKTEQTEKDETEQTEEVDETELEKSETEQTEKVNSKIVETKIGSPAIKSVKSSTVALSIENKNCYANVDVSLDDEIKVSISQTIYAQLLC